MKETKTKYAIYLYPSQMEEIKNLMEQANAKSQSEFVSDAIRFYIGYLQQGKNVNYGRRPSVLHLDTTSSYFL